MERERREGIMWSGHQNVFLLCIWLLLFIKNLLKWQESGRSNQAKTPTNNGEDAQTGLSMQMDGVARQESKSSNWLKHMKWSTTKQLAKL